MVVDVFLSTGATTAGAPNASFDANHGGNRVQVAAFKQVSLPESLHGSLPRPFEYRIPFDRPFNYDGQGPLCWELRVLGRQITATIHLDWASGSDTSPWMAETHAGTAARRWITTRPCSSARTGSRAGPPAPGT